MLYFVIKNGQIIDLYCVLLYLKIIYVNFTVVTGLRPYCLQNGTI